MTALSDFQFRVASWVSHTFGAQYLLPSAAPERALRVAEEAVELAQSLSVPPEQLHKLVDYVYARPAGSCDKELAQCIVTLLSAAQCCNVDLERALTTEINRINQDEVIERCRKRQAEKRAAMVGT